MLTGDKVETARTIGFSCNLLQEGMIIHNVLEKDVEKIRIDLDTALVQMAEDQANFKTIKRGIIVSGDALVTLMPVPELAKKLNDVANSCEAVLCCRVSPKQKKDIVELVKKNVTHVKTLAIGDGANDVNMITEAHIGVGIRGVEGQQAARASDYAVGEFKSLRRLIFLYGRESYRRNSVLVLYSFYKNVVLVMPQFWYAIIFVNMSGVTLYHAYLYQLINVVYTSIPIMLYAIFDRDATDDELEFSPQYYFPGTKKLYFNTMIFWQWFTFGCLQSVIIVMCCSLLTMQPQVDGIYPGFWSFGVLVFTMTILIPSLRILTFSYSYSFMNIFVLTMSFLLFVLSFLILSSWASNEHYQLFSE